MERRHLQPEPSRQGRPEINLIPAAVQGGDRHRRNLLADAVERTGLSTDRSAGRLAGTAGVHEAVSKPGQAPIRHEFAGVEPFTAEVVPLSAADPVQPAFPRLPRGVGADRDRLARHDGVELGAHGDAIRPPLPEPEADAILAGPQVPADIVGHGEGLVLQIGNGGGQHILADLGAIEVQFEIRGRVYRDPRGIRRGGEVELLAEQWCLGRLCRGTEEIEGFKILGASGARLSVPEYSTTNSLTTFGAGSPPRSLEMDA